MALQLRLPLKFFLAFLLTSLTIVVLMVVIMLYSARLNFTRYVHTMEEYRLNVLAEILSEEYQENPGWESLRNSRNQWQYILRPLRPGSEKPRPPRPLSSPSAAEPLQDRNWRPPPPPRPSEDERFRNGRGRRPPPLREDFSRDRPRPARDHQRPRAGKPRPLAIEHRLTLFDTDKKRVVGPAPSPLGHTLKEIVVDGQTVGWLGLRKEDRLSQPLDVAFLQQQSRTFYITGVLMLVLAAGVSFLFARHLLAPIKKLTAGTRAIASRKFETRIAVQSNDELGQLAGHFNRMAHTLDGYEQMQHQWISDIAHELRTPLAVLQGEIEALQDGVRQITPDSLASLHAEVKHLGKIVRDLHDLSMAESGAMHYSLAPLAPIPVLRDVMNTFRARFDAANIVLIDELGENAPQTITGDRSRIVQVFTNLLENTLRYTEQPGTIKIGGTVTQSRLILHFEDSKPGVPAASLEKLFERLYRVDTSRSRTHGGSGLGLAICKSIIEAHGGTIRAGNSSLGGLHMEIVLPCNTKKCVFN